MPLEDYSPQAFSSASFWKIPALQCKFLGMLMDAISLSQYLCTETYYIYAVALMLSKNL